VHAGGRYALLLGRAVGQTASQIRGAATSRTESVAALVADRATGASARGRAVLHRARSWSAHGSTRIALTAHVVFAEALGRGAAIFRKIVFGTRRTSETTSLAETRFSVQRVPVIREAGGRGIERPLDHVRQRAFLSDQPGSKKPWRIPKMRAGPVVIFILVAGGFLLGRMSALPDAPSRVHDLPPRAPAIVSAAPPPAAEEVQEHQSIAPRVREEANSAHQPAPTPPVAPTEIANEARAETPPPAPPAKPSKVHKRKQAKRAVRPSTPGAPPTEALPAVPDEGLQDGWVIRRR
jgi:hypothetical protein